MLKTRSLPDWLAYLEQLHPSTIELGLARVDEVRQRLGLHPRFPIVTVGGTNGKGSTCAMLESMLHAAGYRVGCYTSPHILRYNERVRIGKHEVSDGALCAAFERIEQARTAAPEISLTYFEFGTLAAMLCFLEEGVEAAILEVGLGGRLDAVNVFDADCAVVCSVDIDHCDYLGDTREQIAHEKAGIFRRGKAAVFADEDMPQAIVDYAGKVGARLWRLTEQFSFVPQGQQWDYHGPFAHRLALPLPALRGRYQLNNASAALAVLDALRDSLPVGMAAVRQGLVEVSLPGRFQVLPGRPQAILDVAHNPHAARALARNLTLLPPARTFAVFAMLQDKDIAGVVRALDGRIDRWFVAGLDVPRGASAEKLASALQGARVHGEVVPCAALDTAWLEARKAAAENDRIVVFGSFYTVAGILQARAARQG